MVVGKKYVAEIDPAGPILVAAAGFSLHLLQL
jgi:hypothetical protein